MSDRSINGERRHNLPAPLTSFIGRERELADVECLLGTTRLVTLIGSPGVGKTRLALQVAGAMPEAYPDGVWLVELAALADPTLVPSAVATVLGVGERPGGPLTETLAELLASRVLLLVLDNCEHLAEACAALAWALLRACPDLRILATSRQPLDLAGETTWRVPSLGLPERECRSRDDLARFEALRLFVARARAALPSFAPSDRDAAAIAEVCCRLDGVPLAIELAAARVRGLSVQQLAARLDERFGLLSGGDRMALPRHRTLRALVDWSHELLAEPEQVLLRRLGVFAGGWTLEAAEAVGAGAGIEATVVLDLLLRLVDKSLVLHEEQAGEARYRFLETIREYSRERLEMSGEGPATRRRHAEYYLGRMADLELPFLIDDHDAEHDVVFVRVTGQLHGERDNLQAALAWSQAEASEGRAEGAARVLETASAIRELWGRWGHVSDGRRLTEWMVAVSAEAPTRTRVKALNAAGFLAFSQGEYGRSSALHEEAVAASRTLADERLLAFSLCYLGTTARYQGAVEQAAALLEESLALYRKLGDGWGAARALRPLSLTAHDQGDYDRALTLGEESVLLSRAHADIRDVSKGLQNLGLIAWLQGQYRRAAALCEENLAIFDERMLEGRSGRWSSSAICTLGLVVWRMGEPQRAATLLGDGLRHAWELGDREWIGVALNYLASIACDQHAYWRAAQLLAATESLWAELGAAPWPTSRDDHERAVRAARAALGEQAFAAAFQQGRAMTLAAAVQDALRRVEAVPAATLSKWDDAARHFEDALAQNAAMGAHPYLAQTQHDYAAMLLRWRAAPGTPDAERAERGERARDLAVRALATATELGMRQLADDCHQVLARTTGARSAHPASVAQRPSFPDALTAREVEVLRLLARGLSNKEMAVALVVSVRTAEHHIAGLYPKIGAHNRAEATAYALRHGLT